MKFSDVTLGCICDYSGQVRGKGFLATNTDKMVKNGIGLAPTNLMITSFGDIVDSPWGSVGELLMMPDPETEVVVETGEDMPDEHFMLCDLDNLDGTPWNCCPRHWLRRGLETLESEFGFKLFAAFEHEFHYSGAPMRLGNAYNLDAMRLQDGFIQRLMHALAANDIEPQMAMPEFGPQQFEVTNKPAFGLKAADRAVRLREITRAIARAHDAKATFAPVMAEGGVGNGVHVHFSLCRADGTPASYDPNAKYGLGKDLGHFVAGVLASVDSFIAMTAASNISYERLQPHRWSASYNNLADRDREACLRICPLPRLPHTNPEKSFNVEFRAADATANPYLVLGALVWAGIDGLRNKTPVPEATTSDPDAMSQTQRQKCGLKRLPTSLPQALDLMAASNKVKSWMGEEFHGAYIMNKCSEIKLLEGLDGSEQIKRYTECF